MRHCAGYWKEQVEAIRKLKAQNLTHKEIGKIYGVSRNSISSVVSRYIKGVPDNRPGERGVGTGNAKASRSVGRPWNYSEEALTETWEQRKRRRALEKEAATNGK